MDRSDTVGRAPTLAERLDRVVRAGVAARGRPPYVSVIVLAHHRQAAELTSILDSLRPDGLPAEAVVDIRACIMPDQAGTLGAAGAAARAWAAGHPDTAGRRLRVEPSERPEGDLHHLFPYGRVVNRALDRAVADLERFQAEHPGPRNHIVVRISGDVRVDDPRMLAKLVAPLNDPARPEVFVSAALQDSDWERDEWVRRRLVRPRMFACRDRPEPYVDCSSSAPQGSLAAYLAPVLTELRVSETWGGGEDGVGFTLLDPRIRGVIAREAVVYHCHAGRPLRLQVQVLGEWLCTGIVNKLNGWSGRRGGVDQTAAYEFFMRGGILSPPARRFFRGARRVVGPTAAVLLLRFYYLARVSRLMLGALARPGGRPAAR